MNVIPALRKQRPRIKPTLTTGDKSFCFKTNCSLTWLPLNPQITPSKSQIIAKITSSFSLNCPSAPGLFPNKGQFGQKWLPDTSIFPTPRTFDPLAGDPVLREDLEPDKADTATVVTEEVGTGSGCSVRKPTCCCFAPS